MAHNSVGGTSKSRIALKKRPNDNQSALNAAVPVFIVIKSTFFGRKSSFFNRKSPFLRPRTRAIAATAPTGATKHLADKHPFQIAVLIQDNARPLIVPATGHLVIRRAARFLRPVPFKAIFTPRVREVRRRMEDDVKATSASVQYRVFCQRAIVAWRRCKVKSIIFSNRIDHFW